MCVERERAGRRARDLVAEGLALHGQYLVLCLRASGRWLKDRLVVVCRRGPRSGRDVRGGRYIAGGGGLQRAAPAHTDGWACGLWEGVGAPSRRSEWAFRAGAPSDA